MRKWIIEPIIQERRKSRRNWYDLLLILPLSTRAVHTLEVFLKSVTRACKSPADFTLLDENLIRAYPVKFTCLVFGGDRFRMLFSILGLQPSSWLNATL